MPESILLRAAVVRELGDIIPIADLVLRVPAHFVTESTAGDGLLKNDHAYVAVIEDVLDSPTDGVGSPCYQVLVKIKLRGIKVLPYSHGRNVEVVYAYSAVKLQVHTLNDVLLVFLVVD